MIFKKMIACKTSSELVLHKVKAQESEELSLIVATHGIGAD